MEAEGAIYLCPTPVGNLEDITLRVINTLKSADAVAAEDTRQTMKLLNHFDIKVQLISYHEHNIKQKTGELIAMVKAGKSIAVVTDAGTPGISDPGEELVKAAVKEDIRVESLPGPTAFVPALTASGLPAARFCFEGFLPRKKSEREERLLGLADEERTMLLYEAPHRLIRTLEDLNKVLGNRLICVARELTKKFEEYYRGDIEGAIYKFTQTPPRGEFTLVISGKDRKEKKGINFGETEIQKQVISLIDQGMHKNDAIKKVSADLCIPRKEVYKASVKIKPRPLDT